MGPDRSTFHLPPHSDRRQQQRQYSADSFNCRDAEIYQMSNRIDMSLSVDMDKTYNDGPQSKYKSLADDGKVVFAEGPLASDEAVARENKTRLVDLFKKGERNDPDGIATARSVFDDPVQRMLNLPSERWENIHRFDPAFRWTWREDRAVVKKIDRTILVIAMTFIFFHQLDEATSQQALSDGMLQDLNLTRGDLNTGNLIYELAYLILDFPMQLLSTRFGVDNVVPVQLIVWSCFSTAQFFMNNKSAFFALKFFLGGIRAGMMGNTMMWLANFYKSSELPLRIAIFLSLIPLSQIVGPFLALGILQLRGSLGLPGWRYLFLLEGIASLLSAFFAMMLMPACITQTRNLITKKSWWSEKEEMIIVNRTVRDDPCKGKTGRKEGLTWKQIWQTLTEFDLYPLYVCFFLSILPFKPLFTYFALRLRDLGFNVVQTNLMSVPVGAVGMITMISVTILSETMNNRWFTCSLQSIWTLPFLIALVVMPTGANPLVVWAVCFLLLGQPFVAPIFVGWISAVATSVPARTIAIAVTTFLMIGSGMVASQIYQPGDAPEYREGNKVLIVITTICIVLTFLTGLYYRQRNAYKVRKWNAMTKAQQDDYLNTTTDVGTRRLDFRFIY